MPWQGPFPLPSGEDTYRHWYTHGGPEGAATDDSWLSAYLLVFDDATDLPQLTQRLAAAADGGLVLSPVPMGQHGAAVVHATARKVEELRDLATEIGFQVIAFGAARPARNFTTAGQGAEPPAGDASYGADAVITGLIDIGIAPGNARFRRSDGGTRIEYFWDMNPRSDSSAGVTQGREFSRPELDAAMAAARMDGFFDDEAFSAELGLLNGTRRRLAQLSQGHGTKMLDIAAGYGAGDAARAQRNPIIAVELPHGVIERTDGTGFRDVLVQAMDHVIARAKTLSERVNGVGGADLPLVINISFGTYADRHDGLGAFEVAFAQRAALPQVSAIFLPAGNSFQSRTHARLSGADVTAGNASLDWQVQPGSRAPAFLQMWLSEGANGDALRVSVTPTGNAPDESFPLVDAGADGFWELVEGGAVLARVYAQTDPGLTPGGSPARPRRKITLALAPTADFDEGPVCTAPGTWRLGLSGAGLVSGDEVECWVERGDTLSGFPARGRQSYLLDDAYQRWDDATGDWSDVDRPAARVKRAGTINAMASGRGTIVAGAYRRRDLHPSIFSSADLPVGGGVPDVDLLAETEMSRVRGGLIVAGNRGGSKSFARGTSASSALAARTAVEILMANPAAHVRDELIARAQAFEAAHPGAPVLTPERGGAGRLGAEFPGQARRYTG